MFAAEVRKMKSECWGSRWRGVGNDGTGRPTHFVALTREEMARAAAFGHIDIPESAVPDVVLAQRDRMLTIASEMGVEVEDETFRNRIARLALEELAEEAA